MRSPFLTIEEQKRALRASLHDLRLEKRKTIDGFSSKLSDVFKLHVQFEPDAVIASTIAFNGEADPAALTTVLRQAGHKIALPRIVTKNAPLAFHLYETGDALTTNSFGVTEPLATAPLVVPDVLLVPLLGFDDGRNRLGYGGGYYDRTIAALRQRKSILAIGVGYSFQHVAAIPTDAHDIKMDKIVTEVKVY